MFCKRLENVMRRLADKHLVNVDGMEESRTLKLSPYMDFNFEFQGHPSNLVVLGYHFEQNGDLVPDPALWLWRTPEGWVPFCMEQSFFGARRCARRNADGTVEVTDQAALTEMVEYAEGFAELIESRYLHDSTARAVRV